MIIKDYKVYIPVVVDGKRKVKKLIVKGSSVTEAYLKGVAIINEVLSSFEDYE